MPPAYTIDTAHGLFRTLGIDAGFGALQKLTGLGQAHFDALYRPVLHNVAEAVQLLPASETHHHSRPGGLLLHTLEMAHTALKLRQGLKLPPGGRPEDIHAHKDRWTYALFIGAMLHDTGKAVANSRILLQDGTLITPHSGHIGKRYGGRPYSIGYAARDYKHHRVLSASCFNLAPEVGRAWLAEAPDILTPLTAYLSGDVYEGGIIAEVVTFADRDSTARDIRAQRPRFAPGVGRPLPVIAHLTRTLRTLLAEQAVMLNGPGAMGFVSADGGTGYFVCRPLVDSLLTRLTGEGITTVPRDYLRVYSELLEGGLALPNPHDERAAIWRIRVKLDDFDQPFSCLAFKAHRLWKPTRRPQPFAGTITVEPTVPVAEREPAGLTVKASQAEPAGTGQAEALRAEPTAASSAGQPAGDGPTPAATGDDPFVPTVAPHAGTAPLAGALSWGDDLALAFIAWLKRGLREKLLPYNAPDALVHIVEEGVLTLSPGIFKRFCDEHRLEDAAPQPDGPATPAYVRLQTRLDRRKLHLKTRDGRNMNVHTAWAASARKKARFSCYLFPFELFYEPGERPAANAAVTLEIPDEAAADPVKKTVWP